jgi:histone deacetylase complex subunit SAP18
MSPAEPQKIDRQTTTPFLLKLFYRTGSFHRLEEFSPRSPLPQHLQIYTWPSCSLRELTHLLTGALPTLLPRPSIGTRLAFRLVFPDTRDPNRPGPPRFLCKDLGSVVVGEGEPRIEADGQQRNGVRGKGDRAEDDERAHTTANNSVGQLSGEPDKTLQDARFVIGDYVSVAIVLPMPDGSVAAPLAPSAISATGPGPMSAPSGFRSGRNDFGAGRGGPPSREPPYGGGYGPRRGGGGPRFDGGPRGGGLPSGEWRRGERLPDQYGSGGGYGRGRGRPRPY